MPSPTRLFLGTALGWYAVAAVALFLVVWAVFRFLVRIPPDGGVMTVPSPGRPAADGGRDATEAGA